MNLDGWVYRIAALAMFIGIAEAFTEKMKLFKVVQWLLKVILLWQIFIIIDGLVTWIKGG